MNGVQGADLACFAFPPERQLIAPLYFGGAIRGRVCVLFSYVVLGSVCSFSGFPSGYKNTSRSFVFGSLRLIAEVHLHTRRVCLFAHALLNVVKGGGAQTFHPREDNPAVLVASLRFRQGYRLAVYTLAV